MAEYGAVGEGVGAPAFVGVLETGETVGVLLGAERLAGFNGHTGGIDVGGRRESAGSGIVGAAEIGPGREGRSRGRGDGGRGCCCY